MRCRDSEIYTALEPCDIDVAFLYSYRLSFHPMNSSLALLLFIVLLLLLFDDPLGLPAKIGYEPGIYMPPDEVYTEGTGLIP